ncbi:NAD-dependent dehydratase [Lactobacillus delbrueckii subsp. delbrueckii DSM 20074 = JCM 1012]|uniref:NAD(P)H-binding protein n=1 Tax=Lactobacillus delbrueckii TaxID=1584 RepID=UPI00047106B9|nr:NAD(P)H-binding protein [Lactobacillus delbrueckii]APP09721.1 NAD-dependent dehydratase [Lactobacillus delbrueckii subsp. delbrueckii DSM 20074 = JCM 1012]KNZ38090.1 NAD-dependent dehydratase [Lactobacillus delbrueckii subsp. delbrueckii]KRK23611.1 NAD-dependent dehydratase [Lactobacillus delbrueckii subsp. delbrueckii DSM 20074 = JCM 1012]MCT3493090.1 NAD-dependent epimerase/dehydratase family protein [Lactobacillus delbrueckii]MCT3521590.1 NAD-dependent epimerase/dehydratase family protei
MKVFIAGGSGRVAAAVIQELVNQGQQVYAGSRHKDAIVKLPGVTPLSLDLHASPSELAKLLPGMDAVYFLAGSRGKDLLQTDAFGAVKLIQAAEMAGVKRYIQLSSIFAADPDKWQGKAEFASLTDYYIAKYFADEWLINNSKLDYTILAPATLEEKAWTGKVNFKPEKFAANPIPDVAAVLAQILDKKNTYGKVINMTGGETPISEAIAEV